MNMKKDIHPKYNKKTKVVCACGNEFTTGSTMDEIHIELCSNCHPFYTGKQKLIDSSGRVDKFMAKMKKAQQARSEQSEQSANNEDEKQDKVENSKEPKDEKKPYRVKYLSTNAITLSDKIQIVIRFYGTPQEIHKNYDFVHVTNYFLPHDYDYQKSELSLNTDALMAIMNKRLEYIGSKYPVASLFRIRKFMKRGWFISAGEMLKIAFQISELDLTDPVVLEDQLVGVDTLYFKAFVDQVQLYIDNNVKIDSTYVISIVDKIFN